MAPVKEESGKRGAREYQCVFDGDAATLVYLEGNEKIFKTDSNFMC